MKNYSISLFKGYSDVQPVQTNLSEIVNKIKNDPLVREHTEKHRHYLETGQDKAAAFEKASTPCFSVAVCFEGGKQKENISAFTGLGLIDVDNVPAHRMEELLQRMRADCHTLLAHTTISRCGIRGIYRIALMTDDLKQNPKTYTAAFKQANAYYAELLGCECDMKCKNATRLSGLAHDPDVYFNPDAEPFEPEAVSEEKPKAAKRKNGNLSLFISAARKELRAQGIEYKEHHRNEYIMRMGYLLNAFGAPQEKVVAWATEQFADYNGDVAGVINSCYTHTDEHGTLPLSSGGAKRDYCENFASVEEIESFLSRQGCFRYNAITGRCEVSLLDDQAGGTYTEIDNRCFNTLWSRMCKTEKYARASELRYILCSEFVPLFNPILDYIDSLKPWDGLTDYIDELADTVTVKCDQSFFRKYFKKWFVATVASLVDAEVINHEILVFIGPQGCYKTSWMNRLLPPELRRYFHVKMDSDRITKDDMLALSEFALICLEEIDELRSSEVSRIKAFVTKPDVNERSPYTPLKERRPHLASFCGTTNTVQFLTDLTGNRRWLPFEVESILNPYAYQVNYSGVFAQAYALYKGGFNYWLTSEEVKEVNAYNAHFEVPCVERELIDTYYRRPLPGEPCVFVNVAQILNRINGYAKQVLSSAKIGFLMKQAGFEQVRTANKRGYRVIELSEETVRCNKQAIARYTEAPQKAEDGAEND